MKTIAASINVVLNITSTCLQSSIQQAARLDIINKLHTIIDIIVQSYGFTRSNSLDSQLNSSTNKWSAHDGYELENDNSIIRLVVNMKNDSPSFGIPLAESNQIVDCVEYSKHEWIVQYCMNNSRSCLSLMHSFGDFNKLFSYQISRLVTEELRLQEHDTRKKSAGTCSMQDCSSLVKYDLEAVEYVRQYKDEIDNLSVIEFDGDDWVEVDLSNEIKRIWLKYVLFGVDEDIIEDDDEFDEIYHLLCTQEA